MKQNEKQKAINLRIEYNYGIKTIAKILHVSTSTVSKWLKESLKDDYKPINYKSFSPDSYQKMIDGAKRGRENRIYTRIPTHQLKNWVEIRNRTFEERGRKCEKCGWSETNVHNGFIPVQINHIDGNKKNNLSENLEILCPNCHSLTKHFMFYGRNHQHAE